MYPVIKPTLLPATFNHYLKLWTTYYEPIFFPLSIFTSINTYSSQVLNNMSSQGGTLIDPWLHLPTIP